MRWLFKGRSQGRETLRLNFFQEPGHVPAEGLHRLDAFLVLLALVGRELQLIDLLLALLFGEEEECLRRGALRRARGDRSRSLEPDRSQVVDRPLQLR